jgi:probable rRNA maturation factor
VAPNPGQERTPSGKLASLAQNRKSAKRRSVETAEPSASRRIEVLNRQRGKKIWIGPLRLFASAALEAVGGLPHVDSLPDEVLIVLLSDSRIAEIHREFMNIVGATDVITFQHGEIFISVETAERQSREAKTSLEYELRLYLIHGLLHLAGFEDLTEHGSRAMARRQEKLMKRLLPNRIAEEI